MSTDPTDVRDRVKSFLNEQANVRLARLGPEMMPCFAAAPAGGEVIGFGGLV